MLAGRCARLASRHFHNGKGRPARALHSTRQYSQILNRATYKPTSSRLAWTACAPLPVCLGAAQMPRRFASTQPAAAGQPTIPYEGVTDAQWDALLQESAAAEQAPHTEAYVGWLKDLSLDFGWGPTATMEWLVEVLHVTGGLPWVGAIALAVFAVRGGAFPLYIRSADTAARMAHLRPLTKDMQAQMMEARLTQDNAKMMQITQQLQGAYRAAGVKPSRMILPLLVQAPLGYGLFRLVRNMCVLPVPGLEAAGILWFPDLTMADPYYILPLVASGVQYLSLKRGGETGAVTDPSQKNMMKIMTNVLPGVLFVVSVSMPSGVQLLFFMTAMYGWLQATAFRSPGFRRLVGIQSLPDPQAGVKPKINTYVTPADAAKDNTVTERVRRVLDRAKGIMSSRNRNRGADKRLTKAELDKAREYEKARRAEIEAARDEYLRKQRKQ